MAFLDGVFIVLCPQESGTAGPVELPLGLVAAQRVANAEEHDLRIDNGKAKFEAKMWADPIGGAHLAPVQEKTLRGDSKLGVLLALKTTTPTEQTLAFLAKRSNVMLLHFRSGKLDNVQKKRSTTSSKWFIVIDMGAVSI